jgi:hypothetical protein
MASASAAPAWFVLEYLSAEPWVDGAHGLASPHPRLPLARRFWFPGFSAKTEVSFASAISLRCATHSRATPAAQQALWSRLGVPAPAAEEIRVALFCYPNAPLPGLLDAWADGDDRIVALVPAGVATGALDAWSAGNVPHRDHPLHRGRLSLYSIPSFRRTSSIGCSGRRRSISSAAKTRSCARNGRRTPACGTSTRNWKARTGRSSRPSSIATPPASMPRQLPQSAASPARGTAPPGGPPIDIAWREFVAARPAIDPHARNWAAHLATQPDLAGALVKAAAAWYS